MLDEELTKLISELFVVDPRAKDLFAGELLESFEIDMALSAQNQGLPIPESSYTSFNTFARRLRADPTRTTRLHNFDVYLTTTLVRLMDTRDNFFVALWRDNSAGGPYISYSKNEDRYEVSLLSNYRQLEKRENWFAPALSLFEWYAADTETLGIKLYRKTWSLDNDPVEVASAISLVVTYVLDALAGGGALIQIPRLEDEVLNTQLDAGQLWPVLDDASIGWRLIEDMDEKGFNPPVSQYRAGMDSLIAQHNIRDAIDIAAENDDEVGMYSLEQLLEDIGKREALFKPIPAKLRQFVALTTNIRSRRILPEDHPGYEDPDDFEHYEDELEDNEDAEDDYDNIPVIPIAKPEPQKQETKSEPNAVAPSPTTVVEEPRQDHSGDKTGKNRAQEDDDAPTITSTTSKELWDLLSVFEGKAKSQPKNLDDDTYLVAALLGCYLREISGFDSLHKPQVFSTELEVRAAQEPMRILSLTDGGPNPTVLNAQGVYPGIITRMQARAAKVFEALLVLHGITNTAQQQVFIRSFSDELLIDCKVWSMIKNNKGSKAPHYLLSVLKKITEYASHPRI